MRTRVSPPAAIRLKAGSDSARYVRAHRVLRESLHVSGLVSWNDEPGRTAAEVAAAMRKAARGR